MNWSATGAKLFALFWSTVRFVWDVEVENVRDGGFVEICIHFGFGSIFTKSLLNKSQSYTRMKQKDLLINLKWRGLWGWDEEW